MGSIIIFYGLCKAVIPADEIVEVAPHSNKEMNCTVIAMIDRMYAIEGRTSIVLDWWKDGAPEDLHLANTQFKVFG